MRDCKLKVLGSSSAGNGYILQTCSEKIVIEAGVSDKLILANIDYNLKGVVGVLVTHAHR